MAKKTKKKLIQRTTKKRYTFVEFQLEAFDAPFVLPNLKHAPIGVIDSIKKDDVTALADWFIAAGTEQDYVDAFLSLSMEEIEEFFRAWGKGTLPKS